jgi:hypothetical protein
MPALSLAIPGRYDRNRVQEAPTLEERAEMDIDLRQSEDRQTHPVQDGLSRPVHISGSARLHTRFPIRNRSVFLIGDEKRRQERGKQLRANVKWVIIAGMAVSAASSLAARVTTAPSRRHVTEHSKEGQPKTGNCPPYARL